MSDELQKLKLENENLKKIINEMWEMFYGQGYELANWHLNGDLEPLDNFFEQNDWSIE